MKVCTPRAWLITRYVYWCDAIYSDMLRLQDIALDGGGDAKDQLFYTVLVRVQVWWLYQVVEPIMRRVFGLTYDEVEAVMAAEGLFE